MAESSAKDLFVRVDYAFHGEFTRHWTEVFTAIKDKQYLVGLVVYKLSDLWGVIQFPVVFLSNKKHALKAHKELLRMVRNKQYLVEKESVTMNVAHLLEKKWYT